MEIYRPRDQFEYEAICALKKMIEEQKVSCSFIQRAIGVGWQRGQRIMEWLEEREFIICKELNITEKQFDMLFGDISLEQSEEKKAIVTDEDVCQNFMDILTGKNGLRG